MKRYTINHLYYITKYTPHKQSDDPCIEDTRALTTWCKNISNLVYVNPEEAKKELDYDWSANDEMTSYSDSLAEQVHRSLSVVCEGLSFVNKIKNRLENLLSAGTIDEDTYTSLTDDLYALDSKLEEAVPEERIPFSEIKKYRTKDCLQKDFLSKLGLERSYFSFDTELFTHQGDKEIVKKVTDNMTVSYNGDELKVRFTEQGKRTFTMIVGEERIIISGKGDLEIHEYQNLKNYFTDWLFPEKDEMELYLMMTGIPLDISYLTEELKSILKSN